STVFVFVVLRVLPGDIATSRLGIDATPAALAQLRAEYGFDRSLATQYFDWLGDAARGDLGTSLVSGDDVRGEIAARLDVTVPLVVVSSVIAVAVATIVGQRSALRRRRASGVAAVAISQLGLAVPTFVVGVALVTIFAVRFQVLPSGGFPVDGWRDTSLAVRSLVLPTITLAFTQTAMLVRFARSRSLDFVASDAFRTARAAGRDADTALATATRLVLSPVLSLSVLQLSTLLTGAVVVESVFALPGLGSMMVRDIANRDVTKVQSTLLVIVVAVFVIRLVVDAINDRLDPRRIA
ncbi:MAG: ABC transporter permease, partial [Acidimicrobiia bacterium]